MKYRWKKTGEDEYDERWVLYLILDGVQYPCVEVLWYSDREVWSVFVSGFVCEEKVHIEKHYELLCDAKADALTYIKVWWVTGEANRMTEGERNAWYEEEI